MRVIVLALLAAIMTVCFAYRCSVPAAGRSYGESTECVALVKYACGAPRTTNWRQGAKVKGASIAYGTAIATFSGGRYSGHGAIYLGQNSVGIQVFDQWNGHAASPRTIRWNGSGVVNNGNAYYIVQ
jgi:hypothetical protein